MTSTSPKRKRGPSLPLDTQHVTAQHLLDDEYNDVESPRTKVSKRLDTLELDGQLDHFPQDTISTPQQDRLKSPSPVGPDAEDITTISSQDNQVSNVSETLLSKSPPLGGEVSDTFWHDSEITGHHPDDPNDDGYGINGIGFKPTPAIAWSRSQRRKQQLAELKNREGREARQQRSERRKRFLSESDDASANESSPRKSARVHFEAG